MNDEELITLQSDDGEEHRCRLLGVFEFEAQEYALLLDLGEADAVVADAQADAVVMRVAEQDGERVFRTIEDDAEFDRVTAHVRELAATLDGAGED